MRDSEIPNISGLRYIYDYINEDEQTRMLEIIDQNQWSIKNNRRIQEYGYKYDYDSGSFAAATRLGVLPDWAQNIANRIFEDGLMANVPDQVIVNEYQPGQGIISHIDCIPCFGDTIIILSLGGACVMEFRNHKTKQEAKILLQPGNLLLLNGEARYSWYHGIPACHRDYYNGKEMVRTRRVSMTFREVLFPYR